MEDLKGWATLIGAVIAGCTGMLNLIIQNRGKRDRFSVSPTSLFDNEMQEVFMHIVSLSDHPIKIIDWGWIDSDLKLRSIPAEQRDPAFWESRIHSDGSHKLENRNDIFEYGYIRRDTPIGAYARSVTQITPKLSFRYDTHWHVRLRVKLRVWRLGAAYLH